MQYIVYIYDINGNIIAQIDEARNVSVEQLLSGISTASFEIFHENQYASRKYLQILAPIKICQVVDYKEYVMIDGFLRGIEADTDKITIIVNDDNYLLSRRILHQSYNFVGQSMESIVNTIRNDLNAIKDTGLGLVLSDMEAIVNKEFSGGISFFYVLQELLNDGYEWKIQDKTLYVGKNVGKDRTSGPDYLEYLYDVNEIDSSNIYGVKYNNDGNEIVNGCYFKAKDTVEYKSDQASIDIYDLRESSITEGSSAQEYLDDHKDGVEEFSIDISDENFGNVGLGDTVVVEIRGGNDILQFSGTMRIIGKRWIGEDLPRVEYTVSTSKTQPLNLIEKQNELEKRIKKLELV